LLAGCSADDTTPNPGATTTTATTTTTTTVTDAGTDANPSGVTIDVKHGASTQTVDLGTLTSFTCGAVDCVAVDTIVLAAFPTVTISAISADFAGSDGFDPGSSPNCSALVPIPGANLSKGQVTAVTRNLSWDSSLSYPGCLKVSDLAQITITP